MGGSSRIISGNEWCKMSSICPNVCFRDEWAEDTRTEVAQVFHAYVAEGGANIAAASAAAAPPRPLIARATRASFGARQHGWNARHRRRDAHL